MMGSGKKKKKKNCFETLYFHDKTILVWEFFLSLSA
jgi:hypothetical protein